MIFFLAIDSRVDSRRLRGGSDERGRSDERFSLQISFFFCNSKTASEGKGNPSSQGFLKAFNLVDLNCGGRYSIYLLY
jgi:hypothetical protein